MNKIKFFFKMLFCPIRIKNLLKGVTFSILLFRGGKGMGGSRQLKLEYGRRKILLPSGVNSLNLHHQLQEKNKRHLKKVKHGCP